MINSKDFPCISSDFSRLSTKIERELNALTYDYRMACINEAREKIAIMLDSIQPLRSREAKTGDLGMFYTVQDNLYLLQAVLEEFEKSINNKPI